MAAMIIIAVTIMLHEMDRIVSNVFFVISKHVFVSFRDRVLMTRICCLRAVLLLHVEDGGKL